jgi:hypothetical protein
LLDHGIGHQHFNSRDQSLVCECWNRDRLNIAQIIRFNRPNRVAKAAEKKKRQRYRSDEPFHGAGDGVASGAPDPSGGDEGDEPKLSSELPEEPELPEGAVVLSGNKEAAGGSDVSVSAGGSGAELEAALPAGEE